MPPPWQANPRQLAGACEGGRWPQSQVHQEVLPEQDEGGLHSAEGGAREGERLSRRARGPGRTPAAGCLPASRAAGAAPAPRAAPPALRFPALVVFVDGIVRAHRLQHGPVEPLGRVEVTGASVDVVDEAAAVDFHGGLPLGRTSCGSFIRIGGEQALAARNPLCAANQTRLCIRLKNRHVGNAALQLGNATFELNARKPLFHLVLVLYV